MLAIKNILSNFHKTGCKLACILFCFFAAQFISAQNWQPLSNYDLWGPEFRALYSDSLDNYLYVGGPFSAVNGLPTKGIARWNGLQWDSLDLGLDELAYPNSHFCNAVEAITRYNGEIYVGGNFKSAGSIYARSIGRWNGTTWDSLSVQPFSTNQKIMELTVINNKLYVGGMFTSITGQPCQMFAIWDGTANAWDPVGLPPEMVQAVSVNAICEYQGEVYLGGNFSMGISGDTIRGIIRWDGTNWKSVGGGMQGVWSIVNDLVVYNNELYVGGDFFKADGNKSNAIQKWDGLQWSEVGGGMNGPGTGAVVDMTVHNNKLYVVGFMDYAGGTPASRIAVWDGSQWCGLGSTFNGIGNAVGFYNDTLYMTGGFSTIDGDSIFRITKWLGGDYVANCATYGIDDEGNFDFIKLYPNPAENYVTISIDNFDLFNSGNYAIYNLLGEQIKSGLLNSNQTTIEILDLPTGIYSIDISIGNKRTTKKLLKAN